MELNIFQILILIGFGNSLILLFSFTRIRERYRRPALFLGLFIAGYLLYQADYVIVPQIQRQIHLIIPKPPVLYFLPALLLFFVRSSLNPSYRIAGRQRLFLLPGLLDMGYQAATWAYVSYVPEGVLIEFLTGRAGHFFYEGGAILFSLACMVLLLGDLFRSDVRHRASFRFFRLVMAGMIVILLRWIGIYAADLFAPGSYDYRLQYYFWLFDTAFLLYTGYKILTAPKILKTESGGFTPPGPEQMNRHAEQLQRLLGEKKLYLDPDLTRKKLADRLDLSEVEVSSVMNDGLGSGFYEMVNRCRVEEAVRLIEAGRLEQITVEGLAREAGFRSRSTFNKAFKKHTGSTPSRYHEEVTSV